MISELSEETKRGIAESILNREPYAQISTKYGLPYHFVQYYAKKTGLSQSRKKVVHNMITPETLKEMIQLNSEGKTRTQIANILHLTYSTVAKYIKELNLNPHNERPGVVCKVWHTRIKEAEMSGDCESIFLDKSFMQDCFQSADKCYDFNRVEKVVIIPKGFAEFFDDMDSIYSEWYIFIEKYWELRHIYDNKSYK